MSNQARAIAAIAHYVQIANDHYGTRIDPDVRFDLRGRTAGYAITDASGAQAIRINVDLLERCTDRILSRTVPHEVAHLIVAVRAREARKRTRPHGREWRAVMRFFGAETTRCHDMPTIPARRVRTHVYQCECRTYEISQTRVNRMRRGATYKCRDCRAPLQPGRTED
jgi:SprT protein